MRCDGNGTGRLKDLLFFSVLCFSCIILSIDVHSAKNCILSLIEKEEVPWPIARLRTVIRNYQKD